MKPQIKVCGLRDAQNIKNLGHLDIDYMGFIFYPGSKRYFEAEGYGLIPPDIPKNILKVGVFVDAELKVTEKKIIDFGLNIVQLHGNEDPIFCTNLKNLGTKVWKAIAIKDSLDEENLKLYENSVDAFLFDTYTESKGGSGESFDWNILKTYSLNIPFLVAGGLSLSNLKVAAKIINNQSFVGFDLNSKFEDSPGLKNIDSIKQAIKLIKK